MRVFKDLGGKKPVQITPATKPVSEVKQTPALLLFFADLIKLLKEHFTKTAKCHEDTATKVMANDMKAAQVVAKAICEEAEKRTSVTPRQWQFAMKYDDFGRIEQITATAKQPKPIK